jgi:hypothetical protein
MRTAVIPIDQLPDSLLVEILIMASGVSQQQQREDQPLLISTRKQQRYLCGIFTRVSYRWRLAALSICKRLDVSLENAKTSELLCSWLSRNGSILQHLGLRFNVDPLPLLSTLPTSTPQLKNLRASGLCLLDGIMPVEAAAAWGALSSLTSLEVDTLSNLAPALKQLPNLVELSLTDVLIFSQPPTVDLLLSAMPQLQILRLPAYDRCCVCGVTKQQLDKISAMQQLQHVDNSWVYLEDLSHPFIMSKCYPSLQIIVKATDETGDIADWVQRGGGKQVTKLLICSNWLTGSGRPSISQWPVFSALRILELLQLDLSPGLQQLRGLTQLTHLNMESCTPDLHSLDQLPPGLCSLSLDNLTANAALPEQQQQQQVSTSSTPQLPHLTSLVLTGDRAVSSAGRIVVDLTNLQQLELKYALFVPGSTLDPLSQLTCLSSLSLSILIDPLPGPHRDGWQEGISALAKFPALRQLEVTRQSLEPLHILQIAVALGHLTAIKVCLRTDPRHTRYWSGQLVSGGPLQVRHVKKLVQRVEIDVSRNLLQPLWNAAIRSSCGS